MRPLPSTASTIPLITTKNLVGTSTIHLPLANFRNQVLTRAHFAPIHFNLSDEAQWLQYLQQWDSLTDAVRHSSYGCSIHPKSEHVEANERTFTANQKTRSYGHSGEAERRSLVREMFKYSFISILLVGYANELERIPEKAFQLKQ